MSNGPYDPRAVANLIIRYCEEDNIEQTNLGLQKLLYFSHASYLAKYRMPLVRGGFEAWEYGPVSRTLYKTLKEYGRQPVKSEIVIRDIFTGENITQKEMLCRRAKVAIHHVVETYAQLSPGKLVELSHVSGGAWDLVWNKGKTSATISNIISDDLTIEKFGFLRFPTENRRPLKEMDYEATPIETTNTS